MSALLLALCVCPSSVWAQQSQQSQDSVRRVSVSGKVVSQQNLEPLAYVHVMVLNSDEGTVTDEEGRFELEAFDNDTLLFSRVGFEKVAMNLLETDEQSLQFMLVVMPDHPITLQEVIVYARHPLMRPRRERMDVPGVNSYRGPRIEPEAVTSKFGPTIDNSGAVPVAGMGVTYEGVITAIASRFSKKEQEKKKYLELIEKDAERRAYQMIRNRKINLPLVKRVLELDTEEAEAFLDYFDPSREFVLRASEYDMIVALLRAHKNFDRVQRAINPEQAD